MVVECFGTELRAHLCVSKIHQLIFQNGRRFSHFHPWVNIQRVSNAWNRMPYFLQALLKLYRQPLISGCVYICNVARQSLQAPVVGLECIAQQSYSICINHFVASFSALVIAKCSKFNHRATTLGELEVQSVMPYNMPDLA